MGFPVKPEKSQIDGKYHIVGALQAAPAAVFEKILRDAEPLIKSANTAKVILVLPFPRYVTGKCCNDSSHISNHGSVGFWAELDRPETAVGMALNALYGDTRPLTFSLKDVIGDTVLSELHESSSTGENAIWLHDDPVHLTPELYAAVGDELIKAGDSSTRSLKRARLESVVAQAGPPPKRGATNVRLPDWLTGRQDARPVRGGNSGQYGGQFRGPYRGPYRGWRAPRGGGRRPRCY